MEDRLFESKSAEGSLRTRLIKFCYAYARENYDSDWIRLYMFAGLAGGELNRRYIKRVTEPVLRAIALEIRSHLRFSGSEKSLSKEEIEYLWIFHGGLYYHAIRQHIYRLPVDAKALASLVEITVDTIISGYAQLLKRQTAKRSAKRLAA